MAKSDEEPAAKDRWSWRQVQWGAVWRRQDHANLLLTATMIIAVAVVTFVLDPRDDVWYIYDGKLTLNTFTSYLCISHPSAAALCPLQAQFPTLPRPSAASTPPYPTGSPSSSPCS